MEEIKDILKNRRKSLNLTLLDVANACGVSEATVSRWESGEIGDMKRSRISALAKILNISPSIIVGHYENEPIPMTEYTKIPLYSELCCGNGGFVDDNIVRYVDVPSYGLNPHKEYFCQIASGDSMINAGINDGDLLIFEKTPIVQDNEIGCFCIDDNVATCKKFKKSGSIISLLPMNSKYDPIIIDVSNGNLRCLGKLKYSVREY